jgi:hypothetical protein
MSVAVCDDYVAEIKQYFLQAVGEDRLTTDARNHLSRLTPYVICYAFEVGSKSDPEWWVREGRAYWQNRVNQLVADHLPPTGSIDGKTLQVAINVLADEVLAKLTALLNNLEARALVRATRTNSADGTLITPEDVIKLLAICPFDQRKKFTLE